MQQGQELTHTLPIMALLQPNLAASIYTALCDPNHLHLSHPADAEAVVQQGDQIFFLWVLHHHT